MKYFVVFIYYLICSFKFSLSRDIIGTEGIPSHWKQYRKYPQNSNYHKPHYLPNKILASQLNYEPSLENLNKIILPQSTSLYKSMQPTSKNVLYKNSIPNLSNHVRHSHLSDSNKASHVHNNEHDEVNVRSHKEKLIEDTEATGKMAEDKDESEDSEIKSSSLRSSEKTSNMHSNSDRITMDILHEDQKIPLRQTRQMDSNHPEKIILGDEELEEKLGIDKSQAKKQNTRSSDGETSELQEESDEIDELHGHGFKERESNADDTRAEKTGNIQPVHLNSIYDPRGWIRYRFMPNQLASLNENYVNKLNPYAKDNTFYKLQG